GCTLPWTARILKKIDACLTAFAPRRRIERWRRRQDSKAPGAFALPGTSTPAWCRPAAGHRALLVCPRIVDQVCPACPGPLTVHRQGFALAHTSTTVGPVGVSQS